MKKKELVKLLKDHLRITVCLDRTASWPNGCGGVLRVNVQLHWGEELIWQAVAVES